MATTAPMFLELEQEEREQELQELEEQIQLEKEQQRQHSVTSNQLHVETSQQQALSEKDYHRRGKLVLLAAEKNQLLKLVRLLHNEPTLVNYTDSDRYTPLHRACYGGHIDCVKYLIKHGADIEAKTSDEWRPLHCAVRWNNLEAVEYLVKEGANINAKSSGGNTPLHIASSNGRYVVTGHIIALLLSQPNCDSLVKNQSGDRAFDIAKRSGPFYRYWSGVVTLRPSDCEPLIDHG